MVRVAMVDYCRFGTFISILIFAGKLMNIVYDPYPVLDIEERTATTTINMVPVDCKWQLFVLSLKFIVPK